MLVDPPYGKGLGEKALASAGAGGWLAPGATIVLEEAAGAEIAMPEGFEVIEQRDYGSTQIVFAIRKGVNVDRSSATLRSRHPGGGRHDDQDSHCNAATKVGTNRTNDTASEIQ